MKITKEVRRRIQMWQKRRRIERVSEHINWLGENVEFARNEIPKYEASRHRLQAELGAIQPADELVHTALYGGGCLTKGSTSIC